MARLRDPDGVEHLLPAEARIGRDLDGDVVIDDRIASRHHALLRWSAEGWRLRDLGSRNGTWVEGARLAPGEDVAIHTASRVAFGGGTWTLVDDSAPGPLARRLGGREVIGGHGDLLVFADVEPPLIIRFDNGLWRRLGDAPGELRDGEVIVVADQPWRLALPCVHLPTAARGGPSAWELHFVVAGDDDRVAARLSSDGVTHDLRTRAHHRILLALAREQERDARRRNPEGGWVQPDQLRDYLGMLSSTFYVHLFRLREQLEAVGAGGDAGLVERRETGELRLAPHVRVTRDG